MPDAEDETIRKELQEKPSTALVLHSGGIDSTVCLYQAIHDHDDDPQRVHALSIDYGQRHTKEIRCARNICESVGIKHAISKGVSVPPSMLTNPDIEIPDASYDDLPEGVSPTYVPFRNGLLISYTAGIAQATGCSSIYFGAHAEDAQNWAYPDCTPEFIGAMANAVYIGTYHQVRLVTPLEWLTKDQIIVMGSALRVPFKLTWSCYAGGELHCGTCPTCRARHQGFEKAGFVDPTRYEHPFPEPRSSERRYKTTGEPVG